MSDKLHIETDPEVTAARSRNMSRIRGKDTKPEMIVRRFLWNNGLRYRLNYKRLPGKPDIVLRKYRTCIFVNGCFWHGHNLRYDTLRYDNDDDNFLSLENSACCKMPKTRREFWVSKILRNQERDVEVQKRLAKMGWHSIMVWECELKPQKREATLESLLYTLNRIFLQDHSLKSYELPEEEHQMAAEDINTGYDKR